jgi:hypothetical protein
VLERVFVVLPGAVSVERQQQLVAGIKRVHAEGGTTQHYRYGFDKLAAVIVGPDQRYASWDNVPGCLAQDSEQLLAQARAVCSEVPEKYDVAAIELLGYRQQSDAARGLRPRVERHHYARGNGALLFQRGSARQAATRCGAAERRRDSVSDVARGGGVARHRGL